MGFRRQSNQLLQLNLIPNQANEEDQGPAAAEVAVAGALIRNRQRAEVAAEVAEEAAGMQVLVTLRLARTEAAGLILPKVPAKVGRKPFV